MIHRDHLRGTKAMFWDIPSGREEKEILLVVVTLTTLTRIRNGQMHNDMLMGVAVWLNG